MIAILITRLWHHAVTPLLICCIVQAGGGSACQHSPSRVDVQEGGLLREHVAALEHEPLGPIDLGNAIAVPTDNTEYIIARKEQAVPLLVEALKEEKKPVLVGYAAYCLRRIGSEQGKNQATQLYRKLSDKGEKVTLEERFARSELKSYLEQ